MPKWKGIRLVHKTSRIFVVEFRLDNKLISTDTLTTASAFIQVTDKDRTETEYTFLTGVPGGRTEYQIPTCIITAGHHYDVFVKVTSPCILNNDTTSDVTTVAYRTIATCQIDFRAELTKDELLELQRRSLTQMKTKGQFKMARCLWLYRNKPPEYFHHILTQRHGIMEVYIKDKNGDQASPVNSKLNGLFFGACVDMNTGYPPELSNYGTRRFTIPPAYLFYQAPCMYFADFYCLNKAHYVTIVMTKPGSPADRFCKTKLLPVDAGNNPYFQVSNVMGADVFEVTMNIWIEIYFTENIDLMDSLSHGGSIFETPSRGTSRPEGIPKNPKCKMCNLYL